MPLCISCRGEYWVPPEESQEEDKQPSATRLPWSEENLETEEAKPATKTPTLSSNLEKVYSLKEELPPFICARCGQNNKRWHQWANASGSKHFSRFFFQSLPWGWLALLSFILPLVAYVPGVDFTPVASERIGVPLAILLILVNVALLYALKHSLWRYDLLARVGRGFRFPLASLGIIAFVLALIFGLIIVFLLEEPPDRESGLPENTAQQEPGTIEAVARLQTVSTEVTAVPAAEPDEGGASSMDSPADGERPRRTEGLVRVITTILLALTFVNVTLSAMFMSAHDYGQWLNKIMPQPIYAQERRLLGVIKDGLGAEIRRALGKDRETGQEICMEISVVDLERTSDAGAMLLLNTDIQGSLEGYEGPLRQLQSWRVEADRWGRIIKLSQEGKPRYIEVEGASKTGEGESGEEEKTGESIALVEEKNGNHWDAVYQAQSDTRIQIIGSRRWRGRL